MTALILLSEWKKIELLCEIWQRIPDWPAYEVSNCGRVRSWLVRVKGRRYTRGPLYVVGRAPRLMNPSLNASGYHHFRARQSGRLKDFKVHRVVAQLFIANPERKVQVNHKTGVRSETRAMALEWATSQENIIHAYKYLGKGDTVPRGTQSHTATFTERAIRDIRWLHSQGWSFSRIAQVARVEPGHVRRIVLRALWKSVA